MNKVIKPIAIAVLSAFILIASATAVSAETGIDEESSSPDSEVANPQAETINPEDDLLSAQQDTGAVAKISEDPVVNQLGLLTSILEETDSSSGPGLEDLAIQGVVAEVDPNLPIAPDMPGELEPILSLPDIPSATEEVYPGIVKAQINEDNFYLQGTREFGFYKKGVRVLMEVTEAEVKTYRFPINVPEGSYIEVLQSQQVLFLKIIDGKEAPVGIIGAPWAIDANGNPVPARQEIVGNNLVVTVDARGAELPVVADPSYTPLVCREVLGGYLHDITSRFGTASQYLNGTYCPTGKIWQRGYFPVSSSFKGRFRVVKQSGECGDITMFDSVSFLGIKFNDILIDTFIDTDWQVPCKAHDYCYDLGRVLNDDGSRTYPYVSKKGCDLIFFRDLQYDCANGRDPVSSITCRIQGYEVARFFIAFEIGSQVFSDVASLASSVYRGVLSLGCWLTPSC